MRNLKKQIKEEAEKVSEALKNLLTNFRLLKFKKPAMRIVLMIILAFISINGTNSVPEIGGVSAMIIQRPNPVTVYANTVKDKFRTKLVIEVENYITKMAPSSNLNPEFLVKKCLEYNTDIIFVLSQGIIESHYGTKGAALKTNSVWNVGAYDNQKPRNWYKHPDESLEPYLKLINEKYLIHITSKGDTIYKDLHHLVEDRGYTNYAGKRFASARGYENAMRKFMVKIDMETSISFYQEILTLSDPELLAFFAPTEDLKLDYSTLQVMNSPQFNTYE